MRTKEFRGKRADTGQWVYGHYTPGYIHTDSSWHEGGEGEWWGVPVEDNTVGQLVKEFKGKKFFEGDIARTTDEAQLIIILTWIESNAMYAWLTPEEHKDCMSGKLDFDKVMFWTYAFSYESVKDIKVIGNLHDNPELLERSEK